MQIIYEKSSAIIEELAYNPLIDLYTPVISPLSLRYFNVGKSSCNSFSSLENLLNFFYLSCRSRLKFFKFSSVHVTIRWLAYTCIFQVQYHWSLDFLNLIGLDLQHWFEVLWSLSENTGEIIGESFSFRFILCNMTILPFLTLKSDISYLLKLLYYLCNSKTAWDYS